MRMCVFVAKKTAVVFFSLLQGVVAIDVRFIHVNKGSYQE